MALSLNANGAHVDPELERRGRDEAGISRRLRSSSTSSRCSLASDRGGPARSCTGSLAGRGGGRTGFTAAAAYRSQFVEAKRQPLGEPAVVDEDGRRAMRPPGRRRAGRGGCARCTACAYKSADTFDSGKWAGRPLAMGRSAYCPSWPSVVSSLGSYVGASLRRRGGRQRGFAKCSGLMPGAAFRSEPADGCPRIAGERLKRLSWRPFRGRQF
jgi:hypothetical protein